MKVLIWESKHGNIIVAARTPEERERAWLYLFKGMDGMGYYSDLGDDEEDAYKGAKEGDADAAQWLLQIRDDYEYERVSVEEVIEP